MEQRYNNIRKQLDEFGYKLPLVPEAVPLVEKLIADLTQTTESLRRYVQIARDVIEERDKLQLGAEPYKCDNAKLVKECNDLHLAFLQFKERHETLQRDHKRKILLLEKEKGDLNTEIQKLRSYIFELESKLHNCRCPRVKKLQNKGSSSLVHLKSQPRAVLKSKSTGELQPTMVQAQEKIDELKTALKKLQNEQMTLLENNEMLKNHLTNRDKEISRLNELLEGGRSRDAVNRDCCYKNVDFITNKMQEEINNLRKSNVELEDKHREAIAKQHEAMKRALHLAERNKQLEREMLDIDQMALSVEAECNNSMKCTKMKLKSLEQQVQEMTLQMQSIEKEACELKREKQELMTDLEAIKCEKKHLQNVLETTLEEKKKMNDKINRFTVIENDLNSEIDRLLCLTGDQKCRLADLECQILYKQDQDNEMIMLPRRPKKKSPKRKSKSPPKSRNNTKSKSPGSSDSEGKRIRKKTPIKKKHGSKSSTGYSMYEKQNVPRNTPRNLCDLYSEIVCCNPGCCSVHGSREATQRLPTPQQSNQLYFCPCCSCRITATSKRTIPEELSGEQTGPPRENRLNTNGRADQPVLSQRQSDINTALESIRAERDYYLREYRRLLEDHKNLTAQSELSTLRRQLLDNEQLISTLQHENKSLAQDKYNLMTRLETARDQTDFDAYNLTLKSSIKRLERENELLKEDIIKLEEDRDVLRNKMKTVSEGQFSEKSRYEHDLKEAENKIRKLEIEYRELSQNRGAKSISLKALEDELEQLQLQLKQSQCELNQQRSLYSQLKILQEQTDKTLTESQHIITQLELELDKEKQKNAEVENERHMLENELKSIKSDMMHIKGSMGKIDSEKDSLLLALDEKTERIAQIEVELKARDKLIKNLEEENNDLHMKISSKVQETSSREHTFRSMQSELNALRDDLEASGKIKDATLQENRRLQEELLTCKADCKSRQSELAIARRQIEDLKRQLQTYIAEIKRTEDLISHKEIERNEMLDHFKSLSQEAEELENNNHTLEHAATQSRVQLSLALDHANELERRLEGQEVLIRSYEKQMADLTAQIASLEVQLETKCKILEKVELELKSTKDLCLKLDEQKDHLYRQLNERQQFSVQMDRDRDRLRREGETLQSNWSQDRQAVESLERLLRECRQENVDQSILNKELQTEISRMKTKLEDLQNKLNKNLTQSEKSISNTSFSKEKSTNSKASEITASLYNFGRSQTTIEPGSNDSNSGSTKFKSSNFNKNDTNTTQKELAVTDYVFQSTNSSDSPMPNKTHQILKINDDTSNVEKNSEKNSKNKHKSIQTDKDGGNISCCLHCCPNLNLRNVRTSCLPDWNICRCACHFNHLRAVYSFSKTNQAKSTSTS